uniref:Zinc finger protein n=1 Tax=Solanum tuberosum TaxID=4113 RepID=M1DWL2_SOLTU
MDSSIVNEIYVFPQICNAKRGPAGSSISGNNFSLEINLIAKSAYTCGDNIVKECHFNATCGTYKYKSLSWDIFDKDISTSDFPYPLEKVKWDGVDKILESKDDLIQQVLEFVRTLENVRPPLEDDDTIRVNLIFVKKVFVPPEEFELTKMNIIFNYYENIAAILWNKVCDKIKGYLGQDSSSLYEEFQCLKDFVETIVRETTNWRTYFNEDCEMILIDSLVEVAKREFMSLPTVRSIMQYLHKVDFAENELTKECSICMSKYLPGSEAYNMPCNHSFHSGCIETWLLKTPSCPMCRFKLPPTE